MKDATVFFDHHQNISSKKAIQTATESIGYENWFQLINQTGNWLHQQQATNKNLALLLPNGIPFLQLFSGAIAAGWVATPLDPKWTSDEMGKRLKCSQSSVVITIDKYIPVFEEINQPYILLEDCLKEISEHSKQLEHSTNVDLPFYMGFTSGSSGEPKAFIRSQLSWIKSFDCNRIDWKMKQNEHVLIPGSLIHSHFLYGAISTLALGGTVYLLEKFSTKQMVNFMSEYTLSYIYVVPTMIEALLKKEVANMDKVTIVSSGAKWQKESKERLTSAFPNWELIEFYGASELSFVACSDATAPMDSVGKPFSNVNIEIRKKDQTSAKPLEIGKIYIKSPYIILGYIQDSQGEIQSIIGEDGWCTVHDMGYIDDEGYLYIVGRENNMILYGAINIFPEEIEKVLLSYAGIEEVAVMGQKDEYWGEVITAIIKGQVAKKEVQTFCRKRLASYKIPRNWYYVDEMPLTVGGKISKPALKNMLQRKELQHV